MMERRKPAFEGGVSTPPRPVAPLSPFDLDLLRKHVENGGRISQGTARHLLVTAEALLNRLLAP